MLEHGLGQQHAQKLKERVGEYVVSTVLPALISEETVNIKQPTGFNEDDAFNIFGQCLLQGCTELGLDKVCTRWHVDHTHNNLCMLKYYSSVHKDHGVTCFFPQESAHRHKIAFTLVKKYFHFMLLQNFNAII